MENNVPRNQEHLSNLLAFIMQEYGLDPISIIPAKRGFFGETWRVGTADNCYFLKLVYSVTHQAVYERSFPVLEHLAIQGIDFISRIVKTTSNALFARFDGAVAGLFDWIDGENMETDATKIPEFRMLARVYTVPHEGLAIRTEDFAGTIYRKFFAQRKALRNESLSLLFDKNRNHLGRWAARLEHFAALCREDTDGFHITHGDAGGNLIKNGDKHYLVDWDDPILAPPERDAWNMVCCRDWAGCLFHKALREQGIAYTLRPERLAYYCYHYTFYYLTEYLQYFEQHPSADLAEEIAGYLDGWADDRAGYADRCF